MSGIDESRWEGKIIDINYIIIGWNTAYHSEGIEGVGYIDWIGNISGQYDISAWIVGDVASEKTKVIVDVYNLKVGVIIGLLYKDKVADC